MDIEKIKLEIKKLINDAKFKLDVLPESYFINYFEDIFIKEIEKILK